MTPGTLFLVPTPLDFGTVHAQSTPLSLSLPLQSIEVAARLTHWITENAKSTRAFLKRVDGAQGLAQPLQAMHIAELPRSAHKKGDHAAGQGEAAARVLLEPALQGHDIGLVSEAGMPAIADPGSSVVRAAHAMGLRVVPLVGPVSLMLALAASGLNGQRFAFEGYLPQDATERSRRLQELDALSARTGQSQIVIETPYRNQTLLHAMLCHLHPQTRLAVCCGLGLPMQHTHSALVADWRGDPAAQSRLALEWPAVFLFGR